MTARPARQRGKYCHIVRVNGCVSSSVHKGDFVGRTPTFTASEAGHCDAINAPVRADKADNRGHTHVRIARNGPL
jgi:hypothetical protein